MHHPPRRVGAVLLGALCAVGTAAHAEVEFEEQILVAKADGASCSVSPRGVHVAAVIPKGSRAAVVVDGVEGPKFDQILEIYGQPHFGAGSGIVFTGTTQVIFSADGDHYAYAAKSGAELVVVLDGQEVARAPYVPSVLSNGPLAFSPSGGRLAFTITGSQGEGYRVHVNDTPGPWSHTPPQIVFSPDGAHYAYVGTQADAAGTKWAVVDGKHTKYLGDNLRFTANGALLSSAVENGVTILLANGKPIARAATFDRIEVSPVGARLVMVVTPAPGKPSVLTVDNQVVPGTEGVQVQQVYFSPDGKRYAALCQSYSAGVCAFMIVDGKKELEYPSIFAAGWPPSFSPDSSKFMYVAQQATGQVFLVVDGEESDGFLTFSLPPAWSPSGSRLAWSPAVNPGQKPAFFVESKSVPLPGDKPPGRICFSPDGSRVAWTGAALVVDGRELTGAALTFFVGAEAVDGPDAFVRFSPDSKHFAYTAADVNDGARRGMWVDGTFVTRVQNPQVNRATFTPDSQHVAWAATELKDGQMGYRVYIDGQPTVLYSASALDNTRGAWEMGADGVLTFLGVVDGAIKRWRIPPPSDTNITAMLAAARS